MFKLFQLLIRVSGIYFCLYHLWEMVTFFGQKNVTFQHYWYKGLLTLSSMDYDGNQHFNFIKVLVILSAFLLGYYRTILLTADFLNSFDIILKNYSRSLQEYVFYRMKLVFKMVLKDSIVWLISLILFVLTMPLNIDGIIILVFLVVNGIMILSFTTILSNDMMAFVVLIGLFLLQELIFKAPVISIIGASFVIVLGFTTVGSKIRRCGDEN